MTTTRSFAVRITLAALAATGLLAGCGASLASTDPDGYKACEAFSQSRGTDDAKTKLAGMMKSGELAAKAKTDAIRKASTKMDLPDMAVWLADSDKLLAACTDAGVKVDDVVKTKG